MNEKKSQADTKKAKMDDTKTRQKEREGKTLSSPECYNNTKEKRKKYRDPNHKLILMEF